MAIFNSYVSHYQRVYESSLGSLKNSHRPDLHQLASSWPLKTLRLVQQPSDDELVCQATD